MNVTLVFPPNRNIPTSPYPSLPLLAGCIAVDGHKTQVVDANLEVFERLLRRTSVEAARDSFRATWDSLHNKDKLTPAEFSTLQGLAKLEVVPFEHLLEAEEAGNVLRDADKFYDPKQANHAYDVIANLLRAAYCLNPVFFPLKESYQDDLFGFLATDYDNPIKGLVDSVVIDQILATEPEVVGIAIPFNEQTFEALSLLKELKRRAPHIKTIIGGAIISAYHHLLCTDQRLYEYVDFAMPGEADVSFRQFCTTLEKGGDLSQVPNLYWRDDAGTIHKPATRSLPSMNELESPEYGVMPNERYFLPEVVVTYQTSRGCYYGKCTFCSFDIKQNFRIRKASLVAEDLDKIQRDCGSRHVTFWDPLTPPRFMRDITKWNLERPEEDRYFWGAETKFEKVFTDPAFTDQLAEGGCKFLQFGYESGSQRVLDLMVKGNDLDRVSLMMNTLRNSGVAVSVQWFIGFPGAAEEEDTHSFRFLQEHGDAVLMSSFMGKFTISPDDDIFRSSGDIYDIDLFQHDSGQWDYRHRDGRAHYDLSELNAGFLSRGDAEGIVRMAFFLYLSRKPELAREMSNFASGGLFPTEWEEMAHQAPRMPASNLIRTYDFDVFTPAAEQGIAAEGSPAPAGHSHAIHITNSQELYPLSDCDMEMIALVDGSRSAEEIVNSLAKGNADELRARVLEMIRRGILHLPPLEIVDKSKLLAAS